MATKLTLPVTRDAGITLIELLVVMTVLAILAVGVSLTAFGSGKQSAQSDKEAFRKHFNAMRGLAIQGRSARGLSVNSNGLSTALVKKGDWQIKSPLHQWSGTVTLSRLTPRSEQGAPDIILLSNGQNTAFDIIFSDRRSRPQKCNSDGWAGLICDQD
ncbi:MAG: type II secretion system protein [Sulfitobacter sp.]